MRAASPLALALAAVLTVTLVAAAETPSIDLAGVLERVGERVAMYYARAQSVVCIDTVRLQSMRFDFSTDGPGRQLVYDLRVSWTPPASPGDAPEANVLRELKSVNGRPAKAGDEPECLDPKPISLDPLLFLLAEHQHEYSFRFKGTDRQDGRPAIVLEYSAAGDPAPEISWRDTCVTLSLPSRTTGRVWIDQASGDVIRLDERVMGPYDIAVPRAAQRVSGPLSIIFDRADSTIRYKPVAFHEPEEIVMLPESIESTSVFRGTGAERIRTTQKLSAYQRFVTDARVVP
jgi:hypothetical protein